jgi:hypothetical protein
MSKAEKQKLIVALEKAVYMFGMLTDSQLSFVQPSGQSAGEVLREIEAVLSEVSHV